MLINEFLPNPVGKDADGEWIELFNNNAAANIDGWQIKDASGRIFYLKGAVKQGEYLVLDYKTTKIPLNNDGETLSLYDRNGKLVDKAEYSGKAPEGKSLARQGDKFIFTGKPTPGKENVFINQNKQGNSVFNIEGGLVAENPINQNAAIIYDSARLIDLNFILLGLGTSLFLTFASILIIKKLNLFNNDL